MKKIDKLTVYLLPRSGLHVARRTTMLPSRIRHRRPTTKTTRTTAYQSRPAGWASWVRSLVVSRGGTRRYVLVLSSPTPAAGHRRRLQLHRRSSRTPPLQTGAATCPAFSKLIPPQNRACWGSSPSARVPIVADSFASVLHHRRPAGVDHEEEKLSREEG